MADTTDPFAQARIISNRRLESTAVNPTENPFNLGMGSPMGTNLFGQANTQSDAPVSMAGLLERPSAEAYSSIETSKLPIMMQKFGIDSSGLSMSQLGKIQLVGRLKSKFGDSYADNSDAQGIISEFDKIMNSNQFTTAKNTANLNSKSEMTLNALMKGK